MNVPKDAKTKQQDIEQSKEILQEHLRQYKTNREEMFPSYQGSSEDQKSRDLTRWLPPRYRKLFSGDQLGRGFSTPGTKTPEGSGPGTPQWNLRQSKPAGKKMNFKSFSNFRSESIKKPSVNTSNQPSKSSDITNKQ